MDFREAYSDTCSTVGAAARRGNLHQLNELLEKGCPVDIRDNRGWMPIHEAAYHGRPLCLLEILQTSTYAEDEEAINEGTFEEESALLLAAKQRNVECVKLLLSKGADVNKATKEDYTPIFEAVGSESLDCVKLLLEAGTAVNVQTYTGSSPLHQAAEDGLVNIMSVLLEHGVRLNVLDDNHISPLFTAAHYGKTECLQMLIKAAQENDFGHLINEPASDNATALYVAAQGGHRNCVRLLLDHGADPNIMAENPKAVALHAACEKGYHECMELLFPVTKAEILEECDQNIFKSCLSNLNIDSIKLMIKYGVDINQQIGIARRITDWIKYYCSHPNIAEYPFLYESMSLLCFPFLLRYNRGDPLEEKRHLELTESLLLAGLDPNPHNSKELPPLLAAVILDRPDLLGLLVKYGADIEVRNPCCSGNVGLILSAGHPPPSHCLLQLVLLGARVESCFGRYMQNQEVDSDLEGLTFHGCPHDKWDIQQLFMCYPDSNSWLTCQKLEQLVSLCWNPQLHHGLSNVIGNCKRWRNLKELAVNCSTLSHLCRLAVFKSLAAAKQFNAETLKLLGLPNELIDYMLYSLAGKTLAEITGSHSAV